MKKSSNLDKAILAIMDTHSTDKRELFNRAYSREKRVLAANWVEEYLAKNKAYRFIHLIGEGERFRDYCIGKRTDK